VQVQGDWVAASDKEQKALLKLLKQAPVHKEGKVAASASGSGSSVGHGSVMLRAHMAQASRKDIDAFAGA
jgi:hypothetical protein